MLSTFLSGKIHRATVTEARVDYEGSISIDENLLQDAGIRPYERVEVYNVTTGARFCRSLSRTCQEKLHSPGKRSSAAGAPGPMPFRPRFASCPGSSASGNSRRGPLGPSAPWGSTT